jgi:hypothetical protein
VDGEFCVWEQGEFKRMLIGVYVPPMQGNNNHPGTYRGRLDCWAEVGDDRVAQDFFDIEIQLAREVGPQPDHDVIVEATFGAEPAPEGTHIYWGDFSSLGMDGEVSLYRRDPNSDDFVSVQSGLPQQSEYLDVQLNPEFLYAYKLGINEEGTEHYFGPLLVGGNPKFYMLGQNYPNPVSKTTEFSYRLPVSGHVSIRVYDVAGRMVRTLKDEFELAGYHSMTWDRRDQSGRATASGVYFYRLTAPDFTATKKLVVIE